MANIRNYFRSDQKLVLFRKFNTFFHGIHRIEKKIIHKKNIQTVSVNKTPSLRGSIMLVSYTYGNVIHDVKNIISSQKYQKILVI